MHARYAVIDMQLLIMQLLMVVWFHPWAYQVCNVSLSGYPVLVPLSEVSNYVWTVAGQSQ